ncbi:hypothetical protein DRO24_01400 [Candidatus Bathyarchaeota archaeon]|nr:MAG: hypothetical protein DRO24_01400 [Candidatus Bathyarchaeota archaeon]
MAEGVIFVTEEEYDAEVERIRELEAELDSVESELRELGRRIDSETARLRAKYPRRRRAFRAWDAARFRVYYWDRRLRELRDLRRSLAYWANRLLREARRIRATEPVTAREFAQIWSETFRYIRERILPGIATAERRLRENRAELRRLRAELEAIRDSIYEERETLRSMRARYRELVREADRISSALEEERDRLKRKKIIVRIIYVDAYISRERPGWRDRIIRTPTYEHFRVTKAFRWYWYPDREPLPDEIVEEMRDLFMRVFPFLFWLEYMPYKRAERAAMNRCRREEIKVGATSIDEIVEKEWWDEVSIDGKQLPIVGVYWAEGKKKNIPYMSWVRYDRVATREVDPRLVRYEEALSTWWEIRNDRLRVPNLDYLVRTGQVGRRMRYDEGRFFNDVGMFEHRMRWMRGKRP